MKSLLLVCALTASGCVTILNGATDEIRFESEPPGAAIAISPVNDRHASLPKHCVAPCVLKVGKSKVPLSYTASMPGHETMSDELTSVDHLGAVFLLPALVDGLLILPAIVDLMSQTGWSYPQGVTVVLPAAGTGAPRAAVIRQ